MYRHKGRGSKGEKKENGKENTMHTEIEYITMMIRMTATATTKKNDK